MRVTRSSPLGSEQRTSDVLDMGIQAWRRHHGRDLTANVIVTPSETFEIAVLHEPTGALRRGSKTFTRLEAAKAAADDLLRRSYGHTCTVESCGDWMIWST